MTKKDQKKEIKLLFKLIRLYEKFEMTDDIEVVSALLNKYEQTVIKPTL